MVKRILCHYCHTIFGDGRLRSIKQIKIPKESTCPHCRGKNYIHKDMDNLVELGGKNGKKIYG